MFIVSDSTQTCLDIAPELTWIFFFLMTWTSMSEEYWNDRITVKVKWKTRYQYSYSYYQYYLAMIAVCGKSDTVAFLIYSTTQTGCSVPYLSSCLQLLLVFSCMFSKHPQLCSRSKHYKGHHDEAKQGQLPVKYKGNNDTGAHVGKGLHQCSHAYSCSLIR